MGYTLKRIHEVWHFKDSARGLFAEYVNTWLKLKQESAGWPSWCQTQEQKDSYVRQYKEKEVGTIETLQPPSPSAEKRSLLRHR